MFNLRKRLFLRRVQREGKVNITKEDMSNITEEELRKIEFFTMFPFNVNIDFKVLRKLSLDELSNFSIYCSYFKMAGILYILFEEYDINDFILSITNVYPKEYVYVSKLIIEKYSIEEMVKLIQDKLKENKWIINKK